MWDIFLQNLPTVIIVLIAGIICGAELIKSIRVWKEERQKRINTEMGEKQKELDILAEFKQLHARFDAIDQRLADFERRLAAAEQRLQELTVSDMHDIKSWIVEQYHKFYINQGWIDAFSAETIDRRYEDYKNEGGNSYIDNLIAQLHSLSMDPELILKSKKEENK